jgi:Domain of unknown function (DUF4395)
MKHPRTADPYRDLDVIDANAPRFNQAVIGSLAVVAFLTGWWPLLAILAAQLAIGLTLGRRWCLPCLAYFELVQPRVGEGPIEDSRPPRFANKVGVAFLGTASLLLALGFGFLGWALALVVAVLALGAAATGICAGCEVYRLLARIRGIELCATCVAGDVGGPVAVWGDAGERGKAEGRRTVPQHGQAPRPYLSQPASSGGQSRALPGYGRRPGGDGGMIGRAEATVRRPPTS